MAPRAQGATKPDREPQVMCCKRQVQAKSGHPTENSLVTAGRAEPSGLVPLSCLTELRIMPVKKYPAERREHVLRIKSKIA
jgi:hypothetical protein